MCPTFSKQVGSLVIKFCLGVPREKLTDLVKEDSFSGVTEDGH